MSAKELSREFFVKAGRKGWEAKKEKYGEEEARKLQVRAAKKKSTKGRLQKKKG